MSNLASVPIRNYSTTEAAAILGIDPSLVRRLCKAGRIATVQIENRNRIAGGLGCRRRRILQIVIRGLKLCPVDRCNHGPLQCLPNREPKQLLRTPGRDDRLPLSKL